MIPVTIPAGTLSPGDFELVYVDWANAQDKQYLADKRHVLIVREVFYRDGRPYARLEEATPAEKFDPRYGFKADMFLIDGINR